MSPDLKKIVFVHTEYEHHYYLKMMNADGTNLELITQGVCEGYDEQLNIIWLDNERIIWEAYSSKDPENPVHYCNVTTKEITKINPNFMGE